MSNVAVVGAGKLGLPIGSYFASRGATVTAIDVDDRVVEAINGGRSPIGPEVGMDDELAALVATGALRATTDYAEGLPAAQVVVILVPLLTHSGEPDFTHLDDAVERAAPLLRPDVLVIFETTLPVGTTRNRFAPRLREHQPDARVAFSPERVYSGRIWEDLESYPKLVGGVDEQSELAAAAFYEKHLDADVWRLGGSDAAELVKLAETTYRDINIAFANELARISTDLGVDVLAIIDAANSQPYSHIHRPGIGVGGHCIPHYPYLLEGSTIGSTLVREARSVNERMPEWVIHQLENTLGSSEGRPILLRGVAYRGGVKETASSSAFDAAEAWSARGGLVYAEDPLFTREEIRDLGLTPWQGEPVDAVVVATDHAEYADLDWTQHEPLVVVDGRNALDRSIIVAAGHRYFGIGRS